MLLACKSYPFEVQKVPFWKAKEPLSPTMVLLHRNTTKTQQKRPHYSRFGHRGSIFQKMSVFAAENRWKSVSLHHATRQLRFFDLWLYRGFV